MTARRPASPRARTGVRTGAQATAPAPARSTRTAVGARPRPAAKPHPKPAAARRAANARSTTAVTEDAREPKQITVRTIVLFVVVLMAFIVLAPTLRAYVAQQETQRDLNAEIETAQTSTEELQRTADRWQDDAFVQSQARERLGFVLPGETPYRVVDPETVTGVPVEQETQDASGPVSVPQTGPWYLTVWESVQVAGEVPD